jgi:hypothetical protein
MSERRAAEQAAAAAAGAPTAPGSPGGPGTPGGAGGPAAPDALWAKPRRGIASKVLIGAGLLLLLGFIGASQKPSSPALAASCTKPAFALSTYTPKQARPVTFSVVGPPDRLYTLAVDTLTFEHEADGGWTPVPAPGREESVILVRVKPLKKCRTSGVFALPVPLGTHTVTLFELTGAQAPEVARTDVLVTDDGKSPTP